MAEILRHTVAFDCPTCGTASSHITKIQFVQDGEMKIDATCDGCGTQFTGEDNVFEILEKCYRMDEAAASQPPTLEEMPTMGVH